MRAIFIVKNIVVLRKTKIGEGQKMDLREIEAEADEVRDSQCDRLIEVIRTIEAEMKLEIINLREIANEIRRMEAKLTTIGEGKK